MGPCTVYTYFAVFIIKAVVDRAFVDNIVDKAIFPIVDNHGPIVDKKLVIKNIRDKLNIAIMMHFTIQEY